MDLVNTTGSWPYIMSKEYPAQTYPIACHAQLIESPYLANSSVQDDPVGVTFVSLATVTSVKAFSLEDASATTVDAVSTVNVLTSNAKTITQASSMSTLSSSSYFSSSSISSSSSFFTSTLAAATSPASPTTSLNSTASDTRRSISGTAKAGIIIAIVVVVLGAGGFAGWLIWKKRKQRDNHPQIAELNGRADMGPYGAAHYGRHELEDEIRRKFELHGDSRRLPELSEEAKAYLELEGSGDGWRSLPELSEEVKAYLELEASGDGRGELESNTICYEMPADSPRIKPGFF